MLLRAYSPLNKALSTDISAALALLLDVEPGLIKSAWQDLGSERRAYSCFTVQRKGKSRQIHLPSNSLATLQQKILQRVLYTSPVSSAAFGGVPGRSYIQAARSHLLSANKVLQLDIKDAFTTTRYGLISQALRRRLKTETWTLGLDRQQRGELAGALTHFLTIQPNTSRWSSLPLGAATSVATFNLVWTPIDHVIKQAFHDSKIHYTRYVDDLVLSATDLPTDSVIRIKKILKPYGYQLNTDKQRFTSCKEAVIYGLCLNQHSQITFADQQQDTLINVISRAQHQLHSGSNLQQQQAARKLHGIDALLQQIYDAQQRPSELRFDLPKITTTSTPHNVDELWL